MEEGKTLAEVEGLGEYDKDLTITLNYGGKVLTIPVWRFIEKFLKLAVYDEESETTSVRPVRLKREQIDCYKNMCEQVREGKPMRVNILKARQLGMSTFLAMMIFVLTVFVAGKTAVIIADIKEHAINLFDKYRFYYDNLPQEIKSMLVLDTENKGELTFAYPKLGLKSSIRVMVQGEKSGRSLSADYLHLSECAFWDDVKGTISALLQTVPYRKKTLIAFETTANGYNYYQKIWNNHNNPDSRFKPLFYAWWLNPSYKSKYYPFEMEEWEKELQRKYYLTNEQIMWYHIKYVDEFNKDLRELRQEYPSCPEEAFKSSGDGFFDTDLMTKRMYEIAKEPQPKRFMFVYKASHSIDNTSIQLDLISMEETKYGNLWVYKEPLEGHPYVLNCDPSMGGKDATSIQVIDNTTGEQVAVYRKYKADMDDTAYYMVLMGRWYNNALISCETNITGYILQVVQKTNYPNVFMDWDRDSFSGDLIQRAGYKTKPTNRNEMLTRIRLAFRDNYKIINDYETLLQMQAFQYVQHGDNEKLEATGGLHDDDIMALAGCYYCRGQQDYTVHKVVEKKMNLNDLLNPLYQDYNEDYNDKRRIEEEYGELWD